MYANQHIWITALNISRQNVLKTQCQVKRQAILNCMLSIKDKLSIIFFLSWKQTNHKKNSSVAIVVLVNVDVKSGRINKTETFHN